MWAINILKQYSVKGYVLDKERLKNGTLTYKVYNNGVFNASCNLLNTKNQFVKNNSVIKTNDIYTSGGSGVERDD